MPAFVLLVFLGYNYGFVYGDGDIRSLSVRIDRGPFKDLITKPEKKRFILALEASIRAFGGHDRVLFYDYFPGGYLMTDARPATNTVWQRPEWLSGRRIHILEYLRKPAHQPEMVVRMKSVPDFVGTWLPTRYAEDDSLDRWVLARYAPREETTWYTVFLPNRSGRQQ